MRARNMQSLTNDFKRRYPGVVVYGISDEAHKLRVSDHNEDDTSGSRAAQSDPDNTPEHRAIDVMLGPSFSRTQARDCINEILSSGRLRSRLAYINFENGQWSRKTNWEWRDNSDDPHPNHIHFSGLAANDEDSSPWLGDNDMDQNDRNTATADTWRLITLLQDWDAAEYQLVGEAAPRKEPNLQKVGRVRIEQLLIQLHDKVDELTIGLSDEQLEILATKVANKLRTLTFAAEE